MNSPKIYHESVYDTKQITTGMCFCTTCVEKQIKADRTAEKKEQGEKNFLVSISNQLPQRVSCFPT